MTEQALKDMVRSCSVKAADQLYQASVYSVLGFSGFMLLLALVSIAVSSGAVAVPEFHPR